MANISRYYPKAMPEDTVRVQRLLAASYDIMLRHGRSPNKHRTKLRAHRPKCEEEKTTLTITYTDIRTNIGVSILVKQCENTEVGLGKANQPPQRYPVDLACHHLETIQEKTTRETSQAVERQPGQILE